MLCASILLFREADMKFFKWARWSWMWTACSILLVLGMVLGGATRLRAQNRTLGEIQGSVTDASGASIVGAQISLTNTLTGVVTQATTDSGGIYDLNSLVPGTYTITVIKQGFKTFVQPGVLLRAEAISVNASLAVGSSAQQVTVTAEATLLQTQSPEQRADISEELVTQLPNVPPAGGQHAGELGFTALVPGVQPVGQGGGGNGLTENSWVSVNGTPAATQNWTMDGGNRMVGGGGQGLQYAEVPPEDIQEINYITGNFGAEYGNGYAQFNVTTKGGTNHWHGSAYEYVQNNIFQARNYFSQPGVAVTPFHWNLYGGTLGGPMKRNKAFFFFSYAYEPTDAQSPGYFSLPTAAMRNGDFSGVPVTIYNPNSNTTIDGVTTRMPLPGNQMDPASIDPVAKAAQSYIPLPNYPYADQSMCATASGVLPSQCFFNNEYHLDTVTANERWYNDRIDYDLSPSNRLDESSMFIQLDNPNDSAPGAPLNQDINYRVANYNGQLSDFWSINTHLVNEARFSVLSENLQSSPADYGQGYMQKIGLAASASQFFPGLNWSGYFSGSFNDEYVAHLGENVFVPTDVVTLVRGKHVLKFGGEFDRFQNNYLWNSNESYTFSGIDTRNPADTSSQGLGYADFLFGAVSSWGVTTAPILGERSWNAQVFAQDDYKVKPRLTLNLGVRYEAAGAWSEVQNRNANYDPDLTNPATGTPGAMCYGANTPACPTQPDTLKNLWSPRLGFAWEPATNWTLRGGYGIDYAQNSSQSYGMRDAGLGWSTLGQLNSTDNMTPVFYLRNDIQPSWYQQPTAAFRQPDSQNGNSIGYNPLHQPLSFMQEWRVGVQRAFRNYLFDVAYVGSHGNDLPYTISINQVPESQLYHAASGANMQQYRPNPTFQSIMTNRNVGYSGYNSLQLGLRKEFTTGLSVIANYTWSRTIDIGSATPGGAGGSLDVIQNDYDLNANKGRATSDSPSLFAAGIVYPLPVGKGRAFMDRGGWPDMILGGWQLSSVITAHSGLVYTPVVGTANLSGALDSSWFPNRLSSGKLSNPTAAEWFDPSAFGLPAVGTFGDSGRNILRAPAFNNVDLRVGKSFRIPALGEGGVFEFKADAMDVFNHPNFGIPDPDIGTAGAGQITSATTARNLQLGARLTF
jgi:outer membrane receptor protein involved in Fe transport